MEIYLGLAIKLSIGLIILVSIIRLMGNKEISQVTPLGMAFIVIISDLVSGISVSRENNIFHLIFAMAFWTVLLFMLEKATRKSNKLARYVHGEAVVIIKDGIVDREVMKRMRITAEELRALLRTKGVFDIEEVEIAYIEVSGELSVKQKGR